MSGIIKLTVLKVELSQNAIELIDKGYDRFSFRPFEKNKKFVELRAWTYRRQPKGSTSK